MVPLAVLATLVSFASHGNRIELKLDRGSAEMVWVSDRAFHFRRTLDGPLSAESPERETAAVAMQIDDTAAAVRIRTKFLDVAILKAGLLVSVRRLDGAPLMTDLSEPRQDGTDVTWERQAPTAVHYYGLGALADPDLDLRGKNVSSFIPFLISSAGYGEQHERAGFDFTAADRYRVRSPQIDYYFFYGPTPREIFKQRMPIDTISSIAGMTLPPSWDSLRDNLQAAVHRAMSTPRPHEFNLSGYGPNGADLTLAARISDPSAPAGKTASSLSEELKQRARQFGSLLPNVNAGSVELTAFRKQLSSYYALYAKREPDLPLWHALPFQFPDDPGSAHVADEFLLGDDLLIAPIYESGNKRQVYLPPGTWTSLETNAEYTGPQTIPVETASLPVFARNGAIVPLDSEGGIGLHYFPKTAGEFQFVDGTQLHAGLNGEALHLQIDSKREREYQWVIHNVERPQDSGLKPVTSLAELSDRTFIYDPKSKNLVVRVHVKVGESNVIDLKW